MARRRIRTRPRLPAPVGVTLGPEVYSVSPATDVAAGGATVTVTGVRFTLASAIYLNGLPVAGGTVTNDTTISYKAPAKAAGTYALGIEGPAGTGTLWAGFVYT